MTARLIEDAPLDGTEIVAWFPMLEIWDVCRAEIEEMFGMQVPVWVDRAGEPYETDDGYLDSPTYFCDLPKIDEIVCQ